MLASSWVLAGACVSANEEIRHSAGTNRVIFLLAVEEDQQPVEVIGSAILTAQTPMSRRELTSNPDRLVLISIPVGPDARIHDDVPGFEATDSSNLRLEIAPPPGLPARFEENRTAVMRTALPTDAAVLTARTNSERFEADVTIEAVIRKRMSLLATFDPEHCRPPTLGPLRPFSLASAILGEEGTLHSAAWIDDELAALGSGQRVVVAKRGEPFRLPEPGEFSPEAISASAPEFGLGEDPKVFHLLTRGSRSNTLHLVGAIDGTGPVGTPRGFAVELRTDASGIVGVDTTTITPASLVKVATHTGGLAIAIGYGGMSMLIVPEVSRTSPFAAPGAENWPRALIGTDDPERPFLATTRGHVHEFNTSTRSWESSSPSSVLDTRYMSLASGRDEAGEEEQWIGGEDGTLFRRTGGGPWIPVRLRVPPRFRPCVATAVPLGDITAMGIEGGYLYLASSGCDAVLVVRRSDLCTSVLALEASEPESISGNYVSFVAGNGRMLLLRGNAGLFEAELY
jgi:hypothetical protein